MIDKINEYRKAIAALIVPGLVVAVTAVQPGSELAGKISVGEWLAIAIAMLGTSVVVGAVPNKPPTE